MRSSGQGGGRWDPLDFVWPRLHAALNDPGTTPEAEDRAEGEWQRHASLYTEYLASITWPKGVADLNDNGSLHDARLLDLWVLRDVALLTLKQDNGAWDGRDYVAVVSYDLGKRREVDPALEGCLKRGEPVYWLYDQFAALKGGLYRHHVLFTAGTVAFDFRHVFTRRVFMPPRPKKK